MEISSTSAMNSSKGLNSLHVSSCPSISWLNVERKASNTLSKSKFLPDKRSKTYFNRVNNKNKNFVYTTLITCKRRDNQDFEGGGSRMVDEDMIVLRLRMKELEFMEKGQDAYVPSNWFQWEKNNYLHLQKGFYGAIGCLQLLLMSTRPSVALGIIALAIMSALFSSGLLMIHCIQMIEKIIPRFSPF